MDKLLKTWLWLLEEMEKPHMVYDTPSSLHKPYLLKSYHEQYEEGQDPKELMQAFNHALELELPVPEWVIEGLDADKRFQKYRPLPSSSENIKWLNSDEVMIQLRSNDLNLAKYIWDKGLGYYIKSGKWLSEVAQAVRQKEITTYKRKRVSLIVKGWTWVDDGEITFPRILENLDDLALSREEVLEFEKEHPSMFDLIQEQGTEAINEQFVFKKTGPGWIIVFDRKPIAPLKGIGFDYMHYCIEKAPRKFTCIELEKATKAGLPTNQDRMSVDLEYDESGPKIPSRFQFGIAGKLEGRRDKTDRETIRQAQNNLQEVRQELAEAEENNDVGRVETLQEEKRKLEKFLEESQ
jgi:hypothetical protein